MSNHEDRQGFKIRQRGRRRPVAADAGQPAPKTNPGPGRRYAVMALTSLSPYHQAKRTYASLRNVVMSGAYTIRDINAAAAARRHNPRIRTYRQAMALRTRESLPLELIAQGALNTKRVALLFGAVAVAFSLGSTLSGSWFSALTSALFAGLCFLVSLKHELRIWQLETGPLQPDEPLGSLRQFMQSDGWFWRTIAPRLWK